MMKELEQISYSAFRANLANVLEKVTKSNEVILITRKDKKPTVLISLKQYQDYLKVMGETSE